MLSNEQPEESNELDSDDISSLIQYKRGNNMHNPAAKEFERAIKRVDLMEYWWSRRKLEQDIYKLSLILHAAAPTQTSVERAFSTLSFIMNSLRCKITDDHLEQVLLIRLNKDLYIKACDIIKNQS